MSALPSPFYQFFVYVEPFLSVCGALYAWTTPIVYNEKLLPERMIQMLKTPVTTHQASIMAVRQLGNCYFLLALMSFTLLPVITSAGLPVQVEVTILRAFFFVLAVADITHIAWTLLDLGSYSLQFQHWNTLVHGNVTLVVGLFAWRCAWFRYSRKRLLVAQADTSKTR